MRNREKIRQAGFTLIETLITIIILSIIMAAVFKQIDVAQKRSSAEQQKLDMFQESREFADMMTKRSPQCRLSQPTQLRRQYASDRPKECAGAPLCWAGGHLV